MNPHATELLLLWIAGGFISLVVSVANYWDATSDTRLMKREQKNGMLAIASRDERQAELLRIVVATTFTLAGALAADGDHGMWVAFYLVLSLISIGLSSVRARWNRKAQLKYAEQVIALPPTAADAAEEAAAAVGQAAADKAAEFKQP